MIENFISYFFVGLIILLLLFVVLVCVSRLIEVYLDAKEQGGKQ